MNPPAARKKCVLHCTAFGACTFLLSFFSLPCGKSFGTHFSNRNRREKQATQTCCPRKVIYSFPRFIALGLFYRLTQLLYYSADSVHLWFGRFPLLSPRSVASKRVWHIFALGKAKYRKSCSMVARYEVLQVLSRLPKGSAFSFDRTSHSVSNGLLESSSPSQTLSFLHASSILDRFSG